MIWKFVLLKFVIKIYHQNGIQLWMNILAVRSSCWTGTLVLGPIRKEETITKWQKHTVMWKKLLYNMDRPHSYDLTYYCIHQATKNGNDWRNKKPKERRVRKRGGRPVIVTVRSGEGDIRFDRLHKRIRVIFVFLRFMLCSLFFSV
ncbi:hypothetical protein CsSME_00037110 [Camellia sinensis var. sinensis]